MESTPNLTDLVELGKAVELYVESAKQIKALECKAREFADYFDTVSSYLRDGVSSQQVETALCSLCGPDDIRKLRRDIADAYQIRGRSRNALVDAGLTLAP